MENYESQKSAVEAVIDISKHLTTLAVTVTGGLLVYVRLTISDMSDLDKSLFSWIFGFLFGSVVFGIITYLSILYFIDGDAKDIPSQGSVRLGSGLQIVLFLFGVATLGYYFMTGLNS